MRPAPRTKLADAQQSAPWGAPGQQSGPPAPTKAGATKAPSTDAGAGKGAISQLQEYVQDAKRFPVPSNCPVLQWDYDTRMCSTSLEFRATVAFLLDGVPHHSAGVWKPSKKLAQRDAAERALALYVDLWGDLAAATGREGALGPARPARPQAAAPRRQGGAPRAEPPPARAGPGHGDVEALRSFCRRLAVHHPAPPPEFDHRWDGEGRCHSLVQVELLGVSHTFSGQPRDSPEEADADVARRVLWYLQCPGLEDAFEPDREHVSAAVREIPGPSPGWPPRGDNGGSEAELAERKTALMRLQNRLQQAFARRLEAGRSVWHWTYERDEADGLWPPLYRATAEVPVTGRSFAGGWARGQREAQLDACSRISDFLDALAAGAAEPAQPAGAPQLGGGTEALLRHRADLVERSRNEPEEVQQKYQARKRRRPRSDARDGARGAPAAGRRAGH